MAILRIRTHSSSPGVGIDQLPDLGYPIPGSGGFIELETPNGVESAQNSLSLRELLTDNAYPPNATLILVDVDTLTDIPQLEAIKYLDGFQGESIKVSSVNGASGNVVLDATDVGAEPSGSVSSHVTTGHIQYEWVRLVSKWDVEPSLVKSITGGDVYEYTLNSITRYRFIPSTYSPNEDAFYGSFDNITDDLTDLITRRDD